MLDICSMKPPIEPRKEDCCNSGCTPCIFDVYENQLALFKKYKDTGKESDDELVKNGISLTEYTSFVLLDNVSLNLTHKLLKFKRMSNENLKIYWSPGAHFLFKYVSENNSCTRAYTPIKLKAYSKDEYDFFIIIKRYPNGLVSNFLCDIKIGDETLWRGPYGSYSIATNKYKSIIMIAQGTGIAPFISIIENVLNNEDDITRLTLYYCSQSIDKVLLRDYLYAMKSYWNFSYIIFLAESKDTDFYMYQEPIRKHKLGWEDLKDLKPISKNDQYLLCGSTVFMKEYKNWLRNEGVPKENIITF